MTRHCSRGRVPRQHVRSARELIVSLEELHRQLGAIPYAPVGQSLLRAFSERYLNVDLWHLVDFYDIDPADGPGEEFDTPDPTD